MTRKAETYLTLAKAAELLQCSTRTVERLLAKHVHLGVRVETGRVVAVPVSHLSELKPLVRPGPGNPNFGQKPRRK